MGSCFGLVRSHQYGVANTRHQCVIRDQSKYALTNGHLKKVFALLTIPYYCANYITTVYTELSMIGFPHIYLIGSRLLKLDPASLAKGKYYMAFLKALF